MITFLIFLAFMALLGAASAFGLTADTRDPTYTMAGWGDTGPADTVPRVLSGRRGPRSSADRAPAF